mgnify:CR=1 FL=1
MQEILDQTCPGIYIYSGAYVRKMVDGLIPDFISETKKKIIEVYGNYWHRGEDTSIRINRYRRFGYQTLIVWEEDLKDIEKVIQEVKAFTSQ